MTPLEKLDATIASRFAELLSLPWAKGFLSSVASGDRRSYAVFLIQIFHYTSHTPRTQALVGSRPDNTDPHYQKYCFDHALEETGHELMALHDLRALGLEVEAKRLPRALPATELLVAYLYHISQTGNPVQRLGFTYWAERSYQFIADAVGTVRDGMQLQRANMTFFYNHSAIDAKHADDVTAVLKRVCKTDEDWAAVARVTETTMRLTLQMVEESYQEYARLAIGAPSEYELLNALITEDRARVAA